ncbi:hypothetical protein EJ04DRAFT_3438 [Polyplosphaeria fusca]|uniref:Uncharacterized protein n=1 Tax=Polyplosphaeria fusca TaxID=682080 RepID=A0A9P4VA97_9PLEO|nr:hypothetical protein EJ04DRAFT_3438 [Polyplosphaeria fusca]
MATKLTRRSDILASLFRVPPRRLVHTRLAHTMSLGQLYGRIRERNDTGSWAYLEDGSIFVQPWEHTEHNELERLLRVAQAFVQARRAHENQTLPMTLIHRSRGKKDETRLEFSSTTPGDEFSHTQFSQCYIRLSAGEKTYLSHSYSKSTRDGAQKPLSQSVMKRAARALGVFRGTLVGATLQPNVRLGNGLPVVLTPDARSAHRRQEGSTLAAMQSQETEERAGANQIKTRLEQKNSIDNNENEQMTEDRKRNQDQRIRLGNPRGRKPALEGALALRAAMIEAKEREIELKEEILELKSKNLTMKLRLKTDDLVIRRRVDSSRGKYQTMQSSPTSSYRTDSFRGKYQTTQSNPRFQHQLDPRRQRPHPSLDQKKVAPRNEFKDAPKQSNDLADLEASEETAEEEYSLADPSFDFLEQPAPGSLRKVRQMQVPKQEYPISAR